MSARTVHDHTIMMANQVEETQKNKINAVTYFTFALEDSHFSQLCIIVRYAAGDTLHEESLAVSPRKETTRGKVCSGLSWILKM